MHQAKASKKPQQVEHNRSKEYLIPEGEPCPFLDAIGVMTPEGQVKRSKYAKFRQMNRFLELVNDVVGHLPPTGKLRVVDFGCGKSYLTFAIHHLLTRIHGREVSIIGLDRNSEVVASCTRVARQLEISGIDFREGDIASCDVKEHVDLAVSLHACDTATDDALARAIGWNASVILAVPCCQHELAGKLQAQDLNAIAEHGLLKDRLAALATDSLRAAVLEIVGYKVQVVEFIDMEHTAKNVLIRAVRRATDSSNSDGAITAYNRLKATLGLDELYLEEAMGSEFSSRLRDDAPSTDGA